MAAKVKVYIILCDFGEPSFTGSFTSEDLALDAIINEVMFMERIRVSLEKINPSWMTLKVSHKDEFLAFIKEHLRMEVRAININEMDPLNNRYYRNL